MGKINTITKDYMSNPKYFADSFNYYLFDGQQVIKPDNLQVLDPTEMTIIPQTTSEELVEKIRDVLKQCILMTDEKVTYLLLGIENQADIHYAMPVRNMIYDALNYGKQVSDTAKKHRKKNDLKGSGEFLSGFTKDDKLKPLITLTIYFGSEDWDAPRSLKEMFEETDESILRFVEDYKLHLIIPNEIQDFSKFTTDFGKVMKYIAAASNKSTLWEIRQNEAFHKVNAETARLLNVCTQSNIPIDNDKEEINVSKGVEELREDGRMEGRNSLILDALQSGRSAEEISDFLKIPLEEVKAIQGK